MSHSNNKLHEIHQIQSRGADAHIISPSDLGEHSDGIGGGLSALGRQDGSRLIDNSRHDISAAGGQLTSGGFAS